jgi:proteic killer suppression protein
MVGTFRHKGLKRLFQNDDPSGVRADQAARIRDVLAHLNGAESPTDLDLPGYRLHALKGDLKVVGV